MVCDKLGRACSKYISETRPARRRLEFETCFGAYSDSKISAPLTYVAEDSERER